MNKKIVLTEEQYKKLKFYLLEAEFKELANKAIKKNDIIKITSGGKVYNFIVIQSDGDTIYMDNIDKNTPNYGTRMYMTSNSFNNNNLDLKKATEQQKNETPLDGEDWSLFRFKNVEDIEVDPNPEPKKTQEKSSTTNPPLDLINTLNKLGEGDVLNIKSNGLGLSFIYMDKTGDLIQFKPSDETKKTLGSDNLSSIEIMADEENITSEDDKTLEVNIISYSEIGGNIKKQNDTLHKVTDYEINDISSLENEEKDEINKDDEEEEVPLDKQKIYDLIVNDTAFKNVLYKRPSFWQSFVGELNGESPKTTGLILVQNLLDRHIDKKIEEKFGDNFLKKGTISFEPMEPVEIPYMLNGKRQYFTLNARYIYRDENGVKRHSFGETDDNGQTYNLLLTNRNYEIIVKEKTKKPNIYLCDVIKVYKESTQKNPKGETKRSEPLEDVEIRFLDGGGYKAEETQKNIK